MARQMEITNRQDAIITPIVESILKLASNDRRGGPRGEFLGGGDSSGIRCTSVKLDFPNFTGEDPEGLLYQADEYFAFHGIWE